ncbi:hypothetical protein D3C72_1256870 [compost metagenome]
MDVRQPRVDGEHRHLDGKRHQEGQEDEDLFVHRQLERVPGQDVEGARHIAQVDDGNQGQQRTEEGVQEELERRVHAVGTAPDTDDDEHRDQGCFKEEVEQQAVQRAEHADHQARQDQERAHVLGDALLDHLPGRNDDDDRDERGQWHEPQGQAVDTQRVPDIEGCYPRCFFDELHAVCGVVEMLDQRQGAQHAEHGASQRQPAGKARFAVTAESQDQDAANDRHPDRQTQVRR